MKISFTTLGCPNWDIDTICGKGNEYGFDGVDFRGLKETLDITMLPDFTIHAAQTEKKLADVGLEVCGISSSIRICEPEKQRENLEEAVRTIALCHQFNCQRIRVFGGGQPDKFEHSNLADFGADCMAKILALDGASDMQWLFETHDHWIQSHDCQLLLDRISSADFGVLWDMGHTARVGGESPQETVTAIGGRICYTHVKDAVYDPNHELSMKDGWRYVTPGTGQLPLAEAIAILKENGYDGWIMFEHEKRWHPELPEPELVFPQFVEWVSPLIRS